jgi:restriction system protein
LILDALLKNGHIVALWMVLAIISAATKGVRRSRRNRWRQRRTLFKWGARPWKKSANPTISAADTWEDLHSRLEPRWNASTPKLDQQSWNLELLRALEWKRFELVCSAYFEAIGIRTRIAREGADGGVDIHLYRENDAKPSAIAQCKAWKAYDVGVKPVRELYGVMARQGVTEGIFLTTGRFTKEARSFPKGNELFLWDGEQLLAKIRDLPPEKRSKLLQIATEGDFTTPTCASCGIKLIERSSRDGGESFWGCRNYPRCRMTMKMSG